MEDPTKKIELSLEQRETLDAINAAIKNLERVKVLIESGSDLGGQLGAVKGILSNEIENLPMDLELSKFEKKEG